MPHSEELELELEENLKFLKFKIENEVFVTPMDKLICISKPVSVREIPMSTKYILGMTTFRGQLSVLVDVGKKFALKKHASDEIDCFIYVNTSSGRMCVPVSQVLGVVSFTKKDIKHNFAKPKSIPEEFITGAIDNSDEVLMILDLEKCLDEKELSTMKKAFAS